mgnify:CR=1 FL=1
MTKNIVTSIEEARKLIVWVDEIFETIFPQSHVFEAAERFVIALNPIRRAEGH